MDWIVLILSLFFVYWFTTTLNDIHSDLRQIRETSIAQSQIIGLLERQNEMINELRADIIEMKNSSKP